MAAVIRSVPTLAALILSSALGCSTSPTSGSSSPLDADADAAPDGDATIPDCPGTNAPTGACSPAGAQCQLLGWVERCANGFQGATRNYLCTCAGSPAAWSCVVTMQTRGTCLDGGTDASPD